MKYLLLTAVLLAVLSVLLLLADKTHAQVSVTASVPCNPINCPAVPNQETFEWFDSVVPEKKNVVGTLYDGTEFYNIWISPTKMLFVAGDVSWYVTPYGIINNK